MSRTRLAAVFATLFIASAGAAFAGTPASGGTGTTENAPQLSETFSELHAVSQWSVKLSEMADKRAKSDLVKNYARTITNTNTKLMPTMAEYRLGARPRWRSLHDATFVRTASGPP